MDKTKFLGVLLAAQLVLALWAFSSGSDLSAQRPDEPLLAFEPAAVTAIKIEGPEDDEIALGKSGDGWMLPGAWDAPADGAKVEQLLARLRGQKKGLAVATTSGALERFEVAEPFAQE